MSSRDKRPAIPGAWRGRPHLVPLSHIPPGMRPPRPTGKHGRRRAGPAKNRQCCGTCACSGAPAHPHPEQSGWARCPCVVCTGGLAPTGREYRHRRTEEAIWLLRTTADERPPAKIRTARAPRQASPARACQESDAVSGARPAFRLSELVGSGRGHARARGREFNLSSSRPCRWVRSRPS
jgi:hypothetical protein